MLGLVLSRMIDYFSLMSDVFIFTVCGGSLSASSGNITSPGFETGNYINNLECIWNMANQNLVNSSIVIRFNVLQLETHSSCQFDWLEMREGGYNKI